MNASALLLLLSAILTYTLLKRQVLFSSFSKASSLLVHGSGQKSFKY